MAQSEGYLFADHRASPGIPPEAAERMGLDPSLVREGKVMEAATLMCCGCGGHYIKNLFRTRERGHCFQCNSYICDACDAYRQTHEHVPFRKVVDEVASGRAQYLYGPDGHAILTKIGDGNG